MDTLCPTAAYTLSGQLFCCASSLEQCRKVHLQIFSPFPPLGRPCFGAGVVRPDGWPGVGPGTGGAGCGAGFGVGCGLEDSGVGHEQESGKVSSINGRGVTTGFSRSIMSCSPKGTK